MQLLSIFIHRVLLVYVCLAVVVTALLTGAMKLEHMRVLSVQTGSMTPAFRAGAAVLIAPIEKSNIHVGQIVTYASPMTGQLISHRVVALDAHLQQLTTRGDNTDKPDTPIPLSAVAGRVVAALPLLGTLVNFLRSPLGLVLFLYVPALAIICNELKNLARYYGRGYYRMLTFR